jgi:hypothetical protein
MRRKVVMFLHAEAYKSHALGTGSAWRKHPEMSELYFIIQSATYHGNATYLSKAPGFWEVVL